MKQVGYTARGKWVIGALLAGILVCASVTPAAAQNLVTNGTFTTTSGVSELLNSGKVTGWASTGAYNTAYMTGGQGTLYSPGYYAWALYGSIASPNGTNYAGLDGTSSVAALTQTIAGLVVGKTYTLSFVWALAQMQQATGPDTGALTVSLGASSKTTSTASIASGGFSGWTNQSYSYVAAATSAVLSFMPSGTGAPPMLLIANVSLTQNSTSVPEPASLMLLGTGIAGMLGMARRRAQG